MTAKKIILVSLSNSLPNNFHNFRLFARKFTFEEKWDFPKISRKRPAICAVNRLIIHTFATDRCSFAVLNTVKRRYFDASIRSLPSMKR